MVIALLNQKRYLRTVEHHIKYIVNFKFHLLRFACFSVTLQYNAAFVAQS